MLWPRHPKPSACVFNARYFVGSLQVNERAYVYGFETEQIVLAGVVWTVAFLSSLARACAVVDKRYRGGRRDSVAARVSFACTSGFAAVVWIGCIAMVAGNDWLMSNRFGIVCFSSVVGALGPEQQALFLGSMLEIGNRMMKKKDDDTK